MNNKKAHEKLKEINAMRNNNGVGGFKDSRRLKNERHQKFNDVLVEMSKLSDISVNDK